VKITVNYLVGLTVERPTANHVVKKNELPGNCLWITMQPMWKLQISILWMLEVSRMLKRGDDHVA